MVFLVDRRAPRSCCGPWRRPTRRCRSAPAAGGDRRSGAARRAHARHCLRRSACGSPRRSCSCCCSSKSRSALHGARRAAAQPDGERRAGAAPRRPRRARRHPRRRPRRRPHALRAGLPARPRTSRRRSAEATMSQERTEQPTSKRLRDAAERGQVARSKEVQDVVQLAAALMTLSWVGALHGRARWPTGSARACRGSTASRTATVMPSELTAIATGYLGSLALIVGPVMADGGRRRRSPRCRRRAAGTCRGSRCSRTSAS